jgi:hypothetical protein
MGEKGNSYIPSRPDEYYGGLGEWISWVRWIDSEGCIISTSIHDPHGQILHGVFFFHAVTEPGAFLGCRRKEDRGYRIR